MDKRLERLEKLGLLEAGNHVHSLVGMNPGEILGPHPLYVKVPWLDALYHSLSNAGLPFDKEALAAAIAAGADWRLPRDIKEGDPEFEEYYKRALKIIETLEYA